MSRLLATLFGTDGRRELTLFAVDAYRDEMQSPMYSKQKLADAVGMSRPTVVKYIDELAMCGVYQRFGAYNKPRYRPHTGGETLPAVVTFCETVRAAARHDATNVPTAVAEEVDLDWL